MNHATYSSMKSLVSRFSCLLLDAYGVFWQGNQAGAYPGAQMTMKHLIDSGKLIGIISNASLLGANEIEKYRKHGFIQGTHFHFLITSGDIAKGFISNNAFPFPTLNKKYILFCQEHPSYASPKALFDQSPFTETHCLKEADFIYIPAPHINGLDQTDKKVFLPFLERFANCNKPMVCANPDDVVYEDNRQAPVLRQGTIAKMYEDIGGAVFYTGKPHPYIYEHAYRQFLSLRRITLSDIVAIGDTPETDVRGANSFGIASALITKTGIMAERIRRQGPLALTTLPSSDHPTFLLEQLISKTKNNL